MQFQSPGQPRHGEIESAYSVSKSGWLKNKKWKEEPSKTEPLKKKYYFMLTQPSFLPTWQGLVKSIGVAYYGVVDERTSCSGRLFERLVLPACHSAVLREECMWAHSINTFRSPWVPEMEIRRGDCLLRVIQARDIVALLCSFHFSVPVNEGSINMDLLKPSCPKARLQPGESFSSQN